MFAFAWTKRARRQKKLFQMSPSIFFQSIIYNTLRFFSHFVNI